MKLRHVQLCILALFASPFAEAANMEQSLRSLVDSVISRILPIGALFFLAKVIFDYIRDEPGAKERGFKVAVGVVLLLGVNGVWSFLNSQVR